MSGEPQATGSGVGEAQAAPRTGLRVLVLSGPAGAGKTTIVHRLEKLSPVPLYKAVSATTRPPRPGEVNGEHYHFLTHDEFVARRSRGEFVECEEVHKSGYWYGTLKSEMQRAAEKGAWAFLEIDVRGALQVMAEYPEAVTIFLKTPSLQEYEDRLRKRSTETEENIRRRLQTAHAELEYAGRYRHVVINDNLDRAVAEICDILKTEESKAHAG